MRPQGGRRPRRQQVLPSAQGHCGEPRPSPAAPAGGSYSPSLQLPARPRAVLRRVLPLFLQLVPLAPQLLLRHLQLLPLLPKLLSLLLGCLQAVGQAVLLPGGKGKGS